jgi:acyl dehydratase
MRLADTVLPQVDRFPIEAGNIMMFARAIGDPNPIYTDDNYARSTALGGIIAPPTFTEAAQHYDDDFPFRWRAERPWFGSAREATSAPADEATDDESGTSLHAETHYEYVRPLRPGTVLYGRSTPGSTWTKEGRRSGCLHFRDWVTDYRTLDDDKLCVRCRTVGVTTEQKVSPADDVHEVPAAARDDTPAAPRIAKWPVRPPRASELAVGHHHGDVLVKNLTRAQIIQYAGASGDFSPQHTDEVYNTRVAGYPSVFAHGMLSMAMTGRMLTDWLGDDRLTRFGVRFVRQVWPGDDLYARATVRELLEVDHAPVVALDLVTTNQHNQIVLMGNATSRVDP